MENKNTAEQKRNLKRQRTKKYFLEAAKEMIIREGVESVSVRKVADMAGYSYVTLYNNFADLNELLWDVKLDMIGDLIETMQKSIKGLTLDVNGIKKLFATYVTYYFNHPNIFKFFYFEKLVQPKREGFELDPSPDFDVMMRSTFSGFVMDGTLREQDLEIVGRAIIYAAHGMLTLYISGNGDLTEESLLVDLNKIIGYLLKESTE